MQKSQNEVGKYRYGKRFFDLVFSSLLLFFLALPMLAIALFVALTSRGGAIFRQTRIGRDGKPFVCYKFRTMYRDAPNNRPTRGFPDAAKFVTPIGRFLRRTSLDELPQLFNVLRGDMSLIGPRPLIGEEEEMHRLRRENGVYAVRPGITGLAQINGRDLLDDAEKAAFDAQYVRGFSLRQDLQILGRTFKRVLSGNGIRTP